tara:strand:+ start:353 stop:550 length:198 start_codon:yes stop_codon:yes gene_type:complete
MENLTDGEVLDLIYDKVAHTIEQSKVQLKYLKAPIMDATLRGQSDGRLELAREIVTILYNNTEKK